MFGHRFDEAKQRLQDAKDKKEGKLVEDHLFADIGKRGEKLLAQNLQAGEHVFAKVRGDFGQAFVVTDKHVFIVKWGMQAGSTFGGKCVSFSYPNITGIQIKQQTFKALVQVLTPATQDNRKLSYWGGRDGNNNAIESDSAVTFSRPEAPLFQKAVNLAKQQMEYPAGKQSATNSQDTVTMLDDLHKKGVITDAEYKAKVRAALELE